MRLRTATCLYDIYRIDHVIGLFRMWGITPGKPAWKGRYYPEDKDLWIPQGTGILKMLINSSTVATDFFPIAAAGYQLGLGVSKVFPV